MFSTLKYDMADKQSNVKLVSVGSSNRPQFSSRSQHAACEACRAKKVKCSGQKAGCDRCRSKDFTCLYPKPKRQLRPTTSASAPTEPGVTELAASSTSINPTQLAVEPSYTALENDSTKSRQDRSANMQGFVDHDLGVAADLPHPGPVNAFDDDAAFDALWDMDKNCANNELELEDDFLMCGEDFLLNHCAESTHESASSSNRASLQELLDSSQETATTHRDYHGAALHFDSGNLDPLCLSACTSDWSSILSSPTDHASRVPSGTPSTTGFPGGSPPEILEAADSPNQNTLHPKIPASSKSTSCQCMQTALGILEALETVNSKFNNSAIDCILGLKKDAISRCSLILECRSCTAVSALVVLLIVICEKILMSFEAWSTQYQERIPKARTGFSEAEANNLGNGKITKFFLGVYEVDSEHEQRSILRCLAMVQLRHLHRLLNELQEFAASRNWATHQASLASFVRRLDKAETGLIAREPLKIE